MDFMILNGEEVSKGEPSIGVARLAIQTQFFTLLSPTFAANNTWEA
jgi:hypothetical protein